jgi:hypothetical protein
MRSRASSVLVVLVAVAACVGLGPTAQAGSGPAFRVTVDHPSVRSGQRLTATATATTSCDWVLEWNGDRRVDHARASAATWSAPQVSRPTRIPLHATCFYTSSAPSRHRGVAAGGGAGQRVTVRVPPSWRHTLVVTVLPASSVVSPPTAAGGPHPGGTLPGTGGPALWLLLTGLGAVLVGGAAVRVRPPGFRRPRVLPAP